MIRTSRTAFALLLFAVGACSSDRRSVPPAAIVRDSAGITVVENPGLAEMPPMEWALGDAPTLDLGVLDGAPEYQFYRVQGALRLPDGRILVANAGTGEIRVYDASGAHVGSWGGQGQGPGEFAHTTRVMRWPGSDSIAVWDLRLSRLTLFAGDGSLGRTQTFKTVGDVERARSVWTLPGGHLVLMGLTFPDPEELGGLERTPEVFVVGDRTGSFVAPLGSFPGMETWMQLAGEALNIIRLPLARGNVAQQVGEGMVIASNERFQLDFFGAGGGLERRVRVDVPPRPVTEDLLQAEVELRAGNMPEEARPGYRQSMRDIPAPETLPVFDEVREDALGNVWVRLFRLPSEEALTEWAVFDAAGQLLGSMRTPKGLDVFQIGEDFILGSMEDELDVEHVQLWSLRR